jgi:hypothetical protein
MPAAGFEPTVPASERPKTHVWDRAATGIGKYEIKTLYDWLIKVFCLHGVTKTLTSPASGVMGAGGGGGSLQILDSCDFNILILFMCQIKTDHVTVRLKHALSVLPTILAYPAQPRPPRARHARTCRVSDTNGTFTIFWEIKSGLNFGLTSAVQDYK